MLPQPAIKMVMLGFTAKYSFASTPAFLLSDELFGAGKGKNGWLCDEKAAKDSRVFAKVLGNSSGSCRLLACTDKLSSYR